MDDSEHIRRYLQDAIAAAASSEKWLREVSQEGDDDEVRSLFALHATEAQRQREQLSARVAQLGGASSGGQDLLALLFATLPNTAQRAHRQEERTAHNLCVAFSVAHAACAIYQALASVAHAAANDLTEDLARQFEQQERQNAAKIWRFIPSRAKVAFNMLTPQEIDPAIETKAADDRILT
ncbi:MAG: DUF892 family protein [Acidobacteriaceae bacterium]|nr:DUF892 family protein [Acidobacteriaceae bacterium]